MPLLARKPASLSGGERQRGSAGARAGQRPELLLLDEPLSALDAPRRAEILPYLEAVRREAGIPVLYVTHAIEEVAVLADHLILLEAGRVTAAGPALDVLNRDDLPLALRDDAGVVLEAQVIARDDHGLLALHTPAGTLHAHGGAHPPGIRLRVRIQARDVSLALSRPRRLQPAQPAAGHAGGTVRIARRTGAGAAGRAGPGAAGADLAPLGGTAGPAAGHAAVGAGESGGAAGVSLAPPRFCRRGFSPDRTAGTRSESLARHGRRSRLKPLYTGERGRLIPIKLPARGGH